MKVALFIPCYNEDKTIFNLLEHCKKFIPKEDIYILDNASTDNTVNAAYLAGVNVRCNHINMGIGGSLCYNLQHIPSEYSSVITMDAGWSHDPDDLPKFLNIKYSSYVIVGYRYNWHAPLKRKILSHIARFLLNRKFHTDVDWTSGFRHYPVEVLNELRCEGFFLCNHAKHHAFQFEILAAIDRQGEIIADVPITHFSSNRSMNWRVLWEAIVTYWRL